MERPVDLFLREYAHREKFDRRESNEISISISKELNLNAVAIIDLMLAVQGDAARALNFSSRMRCRVTEEKKPRGARHFVANAGDHSAQSVTRAFAIVAVVILWHRSASGDFAEGRSPAAEVR